MKRKIIRIDEEKCTGCGLCAEACHEGAIEMVNGKARLVREHFCDGLGDCLPSCPAGAISFEEREALDYDEGAVRKAKEEKAQAKEEKTQAKSRVGCEAAQASPYKTPVSRLQQWPCQLKLVPAKAPFFDGTDLLIAADCTAYAYAGMHEEFMRGKTTVIGCPKLDSVDYSKKLTEIFSLNDIRSVTLVRMEVPCCGGLAWAAENALKNSGKNIPFRIVTITIDGQIQKEE